MSEQSAEFQRHPRDGVERLVNEVRALRREVSELRNNTLKQAGVRVEEERLRIESELLVTGDTRIEGTLSLPAGIIDNDALASPVAAGRASASETDFGTTLSDVPRAVAMLDVPTGFSRALIMCYVHAGAISTAPSVDYLYVSAHVGGSQARETFGRAEAGVATSTSSARSVLLTNLTGEPIEISARLHTQNYPWDVSPSNRAYAEAIAIFLR